MNDSRLLNDALSIKKSRPAMKLCSLSNEHHRRQRVAVRTYILSKRHSRKIQGIVKTWIFCDAARLGRFFKELIKILQNILVSHINIR